MTFPFMRTSPPCAATYLAKEAQHSYALRTICLPQCLPMPPTTPYPTQLFAKDPFYLGSTVRPTAEGCWVGAFFNYVE